MTRDRTDPVPETPPPPGDAGWTRLNGQIRADLLVIGAGLTGLATARAARLRGLTVALVEAHAPGAGGSARSAGGVSILPRGLSPQDVSSRAKDGGGLVRALVEAAHTVEALCGQLGVPFAPGLATIAHASAAAVKLRAWAEGWQGQGYPVEVLSPETAAQRCARLGGGPPLGMTDDRAGGAIVPAMLVEALARDVPTRGVGAFGDSAILDLVRDGAGWAARTRDGMVSARRVVCAADVYATGATDRLGPQQYRIPWAVYRTAPLAPEDLSRIGSGPVALSDTDPLNPLWLALDPCGRLVTSGPAPRTDAGLSESGRALAGRLARRFPRLPALAWNESWVGWFGITPRRLPEIVELDDGLVAPIGYQGLGIALSLLAGQQLAAWAAGDGAAVVMPVSRPRRLPIAAVVPVLMRQVVMPLARACA